MATQNTKLKLIPNPTGDRAGKAKEKPLSKLRLEHAERLREAMIDAGHAARRGAAHGCDPIALAKAVAVTKEMARRYLTGEALPGPDKEKRIADWLGINIAWLRDNTPPKVRLPKEARQDTAIYAVTRDIVALFTALPDGLQTYLLQKAKRVKLYSESLPAFYRESIRPPKSGYAKWEKELEADIERVTGEKD